MTSFEDGPAAGLNLTLQRSPKFLRLVVGRMEWRGLDQPEDQPRPYETRIYAYRIHGSAASNIKGSVAAYRFVTEQPTAEELRDTLLWRQWCLRNNHP